MFPLISFKTRVALAERPPRGPGLPLHASTRAKALTNDPSCIACFFESQCSSHGTVSSAEATHSDAYHLRGHIGSLSLIAVVGGPATRVPDPGITPSTKRRVSGTMDTVDPRSKSSFRLNLSSVMPKMGGGAPSRAPPHRLVILLNLVPSGRTLMTKSQTQCADSSSGITSQFTAAQLKNCEG